MYDVIMFSVCKCVFVEKISTTVNREIFVFKNLRAINFRVKKSSSASGSDEDFLTTFFVHTTNVRVPDGRTSKIILYSWSPRVQKQMESSSWRSFAL